MRPPGVAVGLGWNTGRAPVTLEPWTPMSQLLGSGLGAQHVTSESRDLVPGKGGLGIIVPCIPRT